MTGTGISRDDAARAYDSGCWRDQAIITLHEQAQAKGWACSYQPDWAFTVGDDRIVYCTMTDGELYDAMRQEAPLAGAPRCYADGSGMTAAKAAGIGVAVYVAGQRPLLVAEHIGQGTNNKAELMAIWRVLRCFPLLRQDLIIHSDSQYAIGAVTEDWTRNKNVALIGAICHDLELRRAAGARIEFVHVDGHSGHEGNEVADALAGVARKHVDKVTVYGEPITPDPDFAAARL